MTAPRRNRWQTWLRYTWASGVVRRWVLRGVLTLAVMWIGWVVVTGLVARNTADQIKDRLDAVQVAVAHGDLDAARAAAADLPGLAHRAHALTSGPAWWTAAEVPWLGRPFEIARAATRAADQIGSTGVPALLDVADRLDPAKLRTARDTVDLAPIAAARPELVTAAGALDGAIAALDAAPHSSWLPQLDRLRGSLEVSLRSVAGYVDAGARTTEVLPHLLGADGLQRYFVGLQNEAELRGTGGLPGAFAIVEADHGRITFRHFFSDAKLLPTASGKLVDTGLNFGTDYDRAYGASGPTSLFLNSNLSPHFPYAAQIWAAMWERTSGEHVDGAIALDPQVLANFLAVTGPVTTNQGVSIDASNVVALTQAEQYALYADNNERKAFLVDVLKKTSARILDGTASALGLVRAAAASGLQRRMLIWTDDPSSERVIERTDFSGVIADDDRPLAAVVVNNAASGKLDYYLRRSISYARIGCGSTRTMTVTITLANDAPASGLPPYVTARHDDFAHESRPGDNRVLLDYYATAGAQLTSVRVDDRPATAAVLSERGHPVYRFDLEIPQGRTRTVSMYLTEPAGTGSLQVWRQPGVVPIQTSGSVQDCGS